MGTTLQVLVRCLLSGVDLAECKKIPIVTIVKYLGASVAGACVPLGRVSLGRVSLGRVSLGRVLLGRVRFFNISVVRKCCCWDVSAV